MFDYCGLNWEDINCNVESRCAFVIPICIWKCICYLFFRSCWLLSILSTFNISSPVIPWRNKHLLAWNSTWTLRFSVMPHGSLWRLNDPQRCLAMWTYVGGFACVGLHVHSFAQAKFTKISAGYPVACTHILTPQIAATGLTPSVYQTSHLDRWTMSQVDNKCSCDGISML